MTTGNNVFAIAYTYEKCDVSIQYPEDWTVEESDVVADKIRYLANFFPKDDFLVYMV